MDWCNAAFIAADTARQPYQARWERYYKLYRSYVVRRKSDWRNKVFYPVVFWIIEAITPRLVANLPKFLCLPVGPEDVDGARVMEQLLAWAAGQSELYIELVKAVKTALMYGTGILKTYQRQDVRRARRLVPGPSQPVTAKRDVPVNDPETGLPALTPNGEPLFETKEVVLGYLPSQDMQWQPYEYLAYDGPAAEALDIFNVWVAPEAQDVQSARYIVHRTYREMSYIQERVKEGVYRMPENMTVDEVTSIRDDPALRRLGTIELGPGQGYDATRQPVELLEFWTDDGRVITMANRKAILRAHENPFDHGQKPFVRIVDYMVPHEFWGVGEVEPVEGLQDLINALTNQRVDNVRLVLNSMFAVNVSNLEDQRDLQPRPGGIIRTRGDLPPSEVLHRIDIGDVTASAFTEAQATMDTIERTSGVNAYTAGQDSPTLNDTATGISLIQEAGATRFGLKTRLQELMGLKQLARQFGGLLLQFTNEQKVVRLFGPDGGVIFETIDPESLMGSYDYDIETASTAQTESQRRADAMNLLQALAPLAPWAIPQLIQDVLMAFDKKDVQAYMPPPVQPGMVPGMPGAAGPPGPQGFQVPQPIAPMLREQSPQLNETPLVAAERGPAH